MGKNRALCLMWLVDFTELDFIPFLPLITGCYNTPAVWVLGSGSSAFLSNTPLWWSRLFRESEMGSESLAYCLHY